MDHLGHEEADIEPGILARPTTIALNMENQSQFDQNNPEENSGIDHRSHDAPPLASDGAAQHISYTIGRLLTEVFCKNCP